MSGLALEKLLADLRTRDVHLEVDGGRIRVDAPKGVITPEELAVLHSRKTELRSRLEEEARLASTSFEQYGPGCIWTAAELTNLDRIDRLQENDRRAIALLKTHFNIRILSVEDWSEQNDADDRRCRGCRETRFWRSVHGPVLCGRCHPPATPELVEEWLDPTHGSSPC